MLYQPIIRASSMDRVLNCTHSVYLPSDAEYLETSEAAKLGSQQHAFAEVFLKNRNKTYPDAMNLNTRFYVDFISNLNPKYVVIEKRFNLDENSYIVSGQIDALVIDQQNNLYVVDLKNGRFKVNANSYQNQTYLMLLVNTHANFLLDPEIRDFRSMKSYHGVIVQNETVKIEEFTLQQIDDFRKHVKETLAKRIYKTGDHCTFCPSKAHCVLIKQKITKVAMKKYEDASDEYIHETLKDKKIIEKTLEDLWTISINKHPEWFNKKEIKNRSWIYPDRAPTQVVTLSVNQALKSGLSIKDLEDNISYDINYRFSLKK